LDCAEDDIHNGNRLSVGGSGEVDLDGGGERCGMSKVNASRVLGRAGQANLLGRPSRCHCWMAAVSQAAEWGFEP